MTTCRGGVVCESGYRSEQRIVEFEPLHTTGHGCVGKEQFGALTLAIRRTQQRADRRLIEVSRGCPCVFILNDHHN